LREWGVTDRCYLLRPPQAPVFGGKVCRKKSSYISNILQHKEGEILQNREKFKTIADNRQVNHEYFVIETFETGIELIGTEVKSLRQGGINLKDSWVSIDNGEMYVKGMHISPYEKGNIFNRDPMRVRRLLMHKKEILRLFGKIKQDGLTLIPLSIYFKGSLVKVKLGLCKGKKLYDKRATQADRDSKRTIDRALKESRKQ
jgi:SsrA-binding protein